MLNRRSLITGAAGAAAAIFVSTPTATAATYDVGDELLGLYEANKSKIGAPTSNAKAVTGGIKQSFTKGDMYYSSAQGASFVTGKIKTAYDNAGLSTLGLPVGLELTSSKYSSTTQEFAKGRIWYSSKHGTKVVTNAHTVRMKGCKNFRDVAGEGSGIKVSGGNMKRGVVYRSNKLESANSMDKFIVQTLGISTMVRVSPSKSASISGVASVRYNIKNPSSKTLAEKQRMYRQYVTSSSNRTSVGKVLKLIAKGNPIVFQCKRGWDRTGWVAAVIQGLLGASSSDIMAEFLKSNSYYGNGVRREYLDAGVSQLKSSYGTYESYVRACGVDSATIKQLREMLIV